MREVVVAVAPAPRRAARGARSGMAPRGPPRAVRVSASSAMWGTLAPWPHGSAWRSATSPRASSTPWSTPRTPPCSAAAGSTAPSTGAAVPRSWPRAARCGPGHLAKGLPTGQAVATTAGQLPARWVIHTVGPVWSSTEDRSHLLASCYRESLRVADELGARIGRLPRDLGRGLPLAAGGRRPDRARHGREHTDRGARGALRALHAGRPRGLRGGPGPAPASV